MAEGSSFFWTPSLHRWSTHLQLDKLQMSYSTCNSHTVKQLLNDNTISDFTLHF